MAQATNSISWKNAQIEFSPDGVAWTDVSGYSSVLACNAGERSVSDFFTNEGDTPIVSSGKRASLEIAVTILYTETAAEARDLISDAYENDTDLHVRWSPKGGNVGDKQYTSQPGVQKTNPYPGGDPSSSDTVVLETAIQTAYVTEATIV